MPNKSNVVEYLDNVSSAVELSGACNTVINDNGVLTGENTDGLGYIAALRAYGVEIRGRRLVLIGAGGAAAAIATQAALDGVLSIDIFNQRDAFFAKGAAVAAKIASRTGCPIVTHDLADGDALRAAVARADILANASKIGFKGELENVSPLPDTSLLRPGLFVSDAVYAPLKTRLLHEAEAAGCRTMSGIPMMLHQGAAAFKMWTGQNMPLAYVEEHLFS
jgi:shikimate dehydrogenase